MMHPVRVRFAPSPTGTLHIGGARSALYNWLYARQTGGAFVLRLEDTDRSRSTPESVEAIFRALRWLGLDWDEGPETGGGCGPYVQSERLPLYRDAADRLVASGHAYRCYATLEELAAARAEYEKKTGKRGFRYPGWWREKGPADWPADAPYVYRLKVPKDGSTRFCDKVKGEVEFAHRELHDEVLLRSDGTPLYNLGCVVDDLNMGITLVARGDDHLLNTPIQILIYSALGASPPEFAHMPMILDETGKKMSKREGHGSVEAYRDRGFLPDAVLNYLARLGWSHGDQEIFSRDELIASFGWDHVGREAAKYDPDKFEHVQATHLRMLSEPALAQAVGPWLEKRGLLVDAADPRLHSALAIVKARAKTLADAADMLDYFFRDPPQVDDKAERKFLKTKFRPALEAFRALMDAQPAEAFTREALESATHQWMEAENLGFKHFAQSVRVAVSGRSATPGLFEVLEVLGKERVLRRLDGAISLMATQG